MALGFLLFLDSTLSPVGAVGWEPSSWLVTYTACLGSTGELCSPPNSVLSSTHLEGRWILL